MSQGEINIIAKAGEVLTRTILLSCSYFQVWPVRCSFRERDPAFFLFLDDGVFYPSRRGSHILRIRERDTSRQRCRPRRFSGSYS